MHKKAHQQLPGAVKILTRCAPSKDAINDDSWLLSVTNSNTFGAKVPSKKKILTEQHPFPNLFSHRK